MTDFDQIQEALRSAAGLADVLDASWEAFDLLAAACLERPPGPPGRAAASWFAAAAAAEGRAILGTVTVLPASRPVYAASAAGGTPAGPDQAAAGLAGLARLLHRRLTETAGLAGDDGDAAACGHAGIQAAVVSGLLTWQP